MKSKCLTLARLPLTCLLLALVLVAPLGRTDRNGAPVSAGAVAPRVVAPGGTIRVSSPLDNVTADDVITLREAILIAMGGTGPKGLNRLLAPGEIAWCNCDPAGSGISTDCGEGLDDVIQFTNQATYVSPGAELPVISDTGMTTFNGLVGLAPATIDGSGTLHGLDLQSSNNRAMNLALVNMVGYAVRTSGSSGNLLYNLTITNIAGDGVVIDGGSGNRVEALRVGAAGTAACAGGGVTGSAIVLSGATTGNSITGSLLRCNTQYGVVLDGAGTSLNTISGGISGRIDGNGLDGIRERNGASLNSWSRIPIFDNGGMGILKSDHTVAPAPVLVSVVSSGAGYIVSGTGLFGANVEVYQAASDPSGAGEGGTYLATAAVDSGGAWAATIGAGTTGIFTAWQTVNGPSGTESSEFAPNLGPAAATSTPTVAPTSTPSATATAMPSPTATQIPTVVPTITPSVTAIPPMYRSFLPQMLKRLAQ